MKVKGDWRRRSRQKGNRGILNRDGRDGLEAVEGQEVAVGVRVVDPVPAERKHDEIFGLNILCDIVEELLDLDFRGEKVTGEHPQDAVLLH